MVATNYGLGHHFYELPSANAKEYLKVGIGQLS